MVFYYFFSLKNDSFDWPALVLMKGNLSHSSATARKIELHGCRCRRQRVPPPKLQRCREACDKRGMLRVASEVDVVVIPRGCGRNPGHHLLRDAMAPTSA